VRISTPLLCCSGLRTLWWHVGCAVCLSSHPQESGENYYSPSLLLWPSYLVVACRLCCLPKLTSLRVRWDLLLPCPAALTFSHGGMSALLPAKGHIPKSQVRPTVLSCLLPAKACATRPQVKLSTLICTHLGMLVVLPAYACISKYKVRPFTPLPCCIDLHP